MSDFLDKLQNRTENFLTHRKQRIQRKKDKQAAKHPVRDWIESFLWAAFVVLLINQYALQAYRIPSGSMKNTLLISDRIFVNKFIFGPELLPGLWKLPGPAEPKRGQVIIFENPSYISSGPAFDLLQRIIYMVTLSMVDIDKDEQGRPRAHFLIKRAVGFEGDRLRFEKGELYIKPQGAEKWLHEPDFKEQADLEYPIRRMIQSEDYSEYALAGKKAAFLDAGIPETVIPDSIKTADTINEIAREGYVDSFDFDFHRTVQLYKLLPNNDRYAGQFSRHKQGWYIPEGYFFPLGDNRDNSRDARFFGPVKINDILGKAMIKYWPPERIGPIR
ncbi:MAG: signal peptidase I [Spirochaetales bacterium]|nr:signal peptidase I [Spirochaetales bacterium]